MLEAPNFFYLEATFAAPGCTGLARAGLSVVVCTWPPAAADAAHRTEN
jgi:hypothetical protein